MLAVAEEVRPRRRAASHRDAAGEPAARRDRPVRLRRPRPRRGGRAAGCSPDEVVGAADGAAADRRRGGVLARVRLPRRACPTRCARCRGAPGRVPSCRPARWRSPTGTPPSTRPPRREAGSWSGAPASRSSRPSARPTPCWRRGTGSSSPWPARATRRPDAGGAHRRGPRRPAPGPCSRSWRPGCAPSCRTAAAGAWPRWACRRPARPTRCPSRWPTGWSATRPAPGALELTGGGTRLRCRGRLPRRRRGGAPEVRVDGTAGAGRPAPAAGEPGQVLEVGRLQRAAAAPTWRWRAASSGPRWFGSSASDELTGLGAGPLPAGRRR